MISKSHQKPKPKCTPFRVSIVFNLNLNRIECYSSLVRTVHQMFDRYYSVMFRITSSRDDLVLYSKEKINFVKDTVEVL